MKENMYRNNCLDILFLKIYHTILLAFYHSASNLVMAPECSSDIEYWFLSQQKGNQTTFPSSRGLETMIRVEEKQNGRTMTKVHCYKSLPLLGFRLKLQALFAI